MALLLNKLNKEQSLKKISEEQFTRKTVSFYRYVIIEDPQKMRDKLFEQWSDLGVLGRTYVAREGINAQISVPDPAWEDFIEQLYSHPEFTDIPFKIAVEEPHNSFWKLCIKVKQQIVADGLSEDDYEVTDVGNHLSPLEFHEAMAEDGTVVVDVRNHYESRIGKFENALTPDCDTFREELPMLKDMLKGQEDKKILLYCTGGIRCEKASAFLKHQGFQDVNQLHGGIINYTHEIKRNKLPSRFIGKNFVFDDRIAEKITDDILSECDQCSEKCDDYTNCRNKMCNLLFLQCSHCSEQFDGCCNKECQNIANLPEEEQRALRSGVEHNFKRYKKMIRPQMQ